VAGSKRTRRAPDVLQSVVKVLTVSDQPDYEQPWQTRGAEPSSGSGAIVETAQGLRILTNAHVVENHVFVEVQRQGASAKFVAQVEGVGHECDLALLKTEEEFFAGAKPLSCGPLPKLGDRVTVMGYPIGGDRLSITEGVVSRIEVSEYAQTERPLLAIQLDAAINSGNSGGPVFKDGRLIAIAFQALDDAENVSYAIAGPIVEHFLKDVNDGTFHGFPDFGIAWQCLESPAQRAYLKLPDRRRGVLVTGIEYQGSAWKQLEPGDVVLAIDGVDVACDGTIPLRKGEPVDLSYAITRHQVGQTVPVTIWRRGRQRRLEIRLERPLRLVPEDRYDVRPTYFVYAGLVFVPLTRDYLKAWGDHWWHHAPHALMALHEHGIRSKDRVEVVLISKILADTANQGYHSLENAIVSRIDDRKVSHMQDLVKLVEGAQSKHLRIQLEYGAEIVLDRALARARHAAILSKYRVPADRSEDLRDPAKSPTKKRKAAPRGS
jgi:S1-C subfamily serine protease